MDLGDLMEYRRRGMGKGDFGGGAGNAMSSTKTTTNTAMLPQSLKQKLDKIESSKMRAACRHMMSLDPSTRLSPIEYLERLSSSSTSATTTSSKTAGGSTGRTIESDESKNERSTHAPIPSCFGSVLYPFMLRLRTRILSPDARIALVAMKYGEILRATVGVDDDWGSAYFSRLIGPTLRRCADSTSADVDRPKTEPKSSEETKRIDLSDLSMNELLLETEDLLRQIDSGAFDFNADNPSDLTDTTPPVVAMVDHFPKSSSRADWQSQPPPSQSSIIILLQVVFSSVGHVQRASSKFVALKLMHRIAIFSSDEIRLQRIVPFVTSLLNDSEPIVRASGISVLASVLSRE
jgi:phosphoinositide-3-kinase regulatory subunit 4